MSVIQDNVNKIVKQKENQDLADSITGQRMQEFEQFLENQKSIAESFNPEELGYINSGYYSYYLNVLAYLERYADDLAVQMIATHEFNQINFNDAYFRGIKSSIKISGIGFPVPEKFQEQIKNTIKNKLCENLTIEDAEFEVNIFPQEYDIIGAKRNIGKPSYSYSLNIELKRKKVKQKQK